MPRQRTALAVAAALALSSLAAQATVITTVAGDTTTYSENFNHNATSFTLSSPALLWNTVANPDDYLLVSGIHGAASYSIQAPKALKSLSIGFWYGASATGDGVAELNGVAYGSAPNGMSLASYLLLNPGAGAGGGGNYFTTTWTDLQPGTYTFTFRTSGQLLDSFKLDDVVITATAVPEPGSLALALVSLLALAGTARRQRG